MHQEAQVCQELQEKMVRMEDTESDLREIEDTLVQLVQLERAVPQVVPDYQDPPEQPERVVPQDMQELLVGA